MSRSKVKKNRLSDVQTKGKRKMSMNRDADERLISIESDCANKVYKDSDIKNGYIEMGSINLEFSEISCTYDLEECIQYESWLSESDIFNVYDSSKKGRYILCRP